jgi:hypothetical protein
VLLLKPEKTEQRLAPQTMNLGDSTMHPAAKTPLDAPCFAVGEDPGPPEHEQKPTACSSDHKRRPPDPDGCNLDCCDTGVKKTPVSALEPRVECTSNG